MSLLSGVFTKSHSRLILAILIASIFALGVAVFASSTVLAALVCSNDTAGANDEPGQKDLTQLCVDNAGLPTSLQITWNWDEISVTGNNTLDACALFDTDNDGNVNFSLCVTDPTDAAITVTLYTCGDDANDRCTQPSLLFQRSHPLAQPVPKIQTLSLLVMSSRRIVSHPVTSCLRMSARHQPSC